MRTQHVAAFDLSKGRVYLVLLQSPRKRGNGPTMSVHHGLLQRRVWLHLQDGLDRRRRLDLIFSQDEDLAAR